MRILFVLPLLCLAIGFAVGTPVYAQYDPLIPIPGMGGTLNTETYIRILYIVAIVIAAFVAVGKLAYAGFKYVASASISQKTDAKQDIFGAIIGLVIILTAVAILTTINPQISNLAGLRSINVPPPNQPRAESVASDPNATSRQKRGILTDEEVEMLFELESEVLVDSLDFTGSESGNLEIREFSRNCRDTYENASVRIKVKDRENGIKTIGCIIPEIEASRTDST